MEKNVLKKNVRKVHNLALRRTNTKLCRYIGSKKRRSYAKERCVKSINKKFQILNANE